MSGGHEMHSSQGVPQAYMTQASQDWSDLPGEETQADPPIPAAPTANWPCIQEQPKPQSSSQQVPLTAGHSPSAAHADSGVPQHEQAAAQAPSRLLMKIKSRAAAAAIKNAVASPAASSRQAGLPSLPAPALAQHCTASTPQQAEQAMSEMETAAESAPEAATEDPAAAAAIAAAEQAKLAVVSAEAAQHECKALIACAEAAATAHAERQAGRYTELLQKTAAVAATCSEHRSSLDVLQSISNTHGAKLDTVQSTCQTLVGLMHGLAAQTEQALTVFQSAQNPQPTVTILRCIDTFTQTSPVTTRPQAVQAQLSMTAPVYALPPQVPTIMSISFKYMATLLLRHAMYCIACQLRPGGVRSVSFTLRDFVPVAVVACYSLAYDCSYLK